MRQIIVFFFFNLFIAGLYANGYAMSQENSNYKVSIMEEEEEHGSSLYEPQECLSNENFFEGYIITSFNPFQHSSTYHQAFYEDVYLSCIETPPDFII